MVELNARSGAAEFGLRWSSELQEFSADASVVTAGSSIGENDATLFKSFATCESPDVGVALSIASWECRQPHLSLTMGFDSSASTDFEL